MALYCLRHIPSGRICDTENGICYVTFTSRQLAQSAIAFDIDPQWQANYEVCELPANLQPAEKESIVRIVRVYAVTYELSIGPDTYPEIHSTNVEIPDELEDWEIASEIELALFVQLGHDNYNILSYVYMSDKGY